MEDKEHGPTAVSLGRHKRWAPRAKTGCATCRKRKIKCDEARPRCCRCVRAGISCLGYLTDMAPAESSVSLTLSPGSLPQYNGSQDMRDVLLLLPQVNKSAPVPPDDVCRGMRIAVEVVLHDLPRRTGHSVALDKAVICVAATLKEMSAQLRTADVDTMTKAQMTLTMSNSYAAALSALRNDLSDPIRSTSAETLFAVQLLCCFESFQESHSETILRHLFGISKILEHRGPHRFTAKPQIDILFQQLPAVTWSSLAYNISNFLCRSSWEALIKPAELSGDSQSRLYLGLHRNAAHVITLLSECTSLIKASRNGKRHPVWHISLLQKLKHTRRMFMRWYFRMIDDLSPLDGLSDTVSVLELLYKRTSTRWAFFPLSACQIFCNLILRLPVALGCDNALKVEQQTQEHARNLKTLYLKLEEEDPKFPMPEMEMENIDATLSTADGWWKFAAQADNGRQVDRLSLIPEDTFRNWLQLMEIYC